MLVVAQTAFRHHDAARIALQQARRERLFEPGDLARNGRRRGPQRLGGLGEAAVLHHADEGPDTLQQVHSNSFAGPRPAPSQPTPGRTFGLQPPPSAL
ncbi:Uncharacterised protein [Pseudomonas aeruginosa]|nr:Uncharacterised protein [Pseudomonas aeruginosa]